MCQAYYVTKINRLQNIKLKTFNSRYEYTVFFFFLLFFFLCNQVICEMWCSRCAFPNTPKFKQVWGKGHIVSKEWVENCHSKRRRLPWRRLVSLTKDILCELEEFQLSCFDVQVKEHVC
jgi:hypothetical protein